MNAPTPDRIPARVKPLLFSPAAHADLAAIWRYSAEHWGEEQADRYIDDIRDACHALASGTFQGRPVDVRTGYLKYRVGVHMVYFRDQTGCVEIIRILHGRMDATQHL